MANYTRFQNVEAKGELKAKKAKIGLTKATYTATSTNGAAAAGEAPTKAEFDAVVTLLNEIKSKHNKLVSQIITGSDT